MTIEAYLPIIAHHEVRTGVWRYVCGQSCAKAVAECQTGVISGIGKGVIGTTCHKGTIWSLLTTDMIASSTGLLLKTVGLKIRGCPSWPQPLLTIHARFLYQG